VFVCLCSRDAIVVVVVVNSRCCDKVALLSARAVVIHPEEGNETLDMDNIADEELNVQENEEDYNDADNTPVAAQVEILYDIKQTVLSVAASSSETEATNDDDDDDDDDESKEETLTGTTVFVGVLEGWLNGNPEGLKELRWKLAAVRMPWEFPTIQSY